MIPRVLFTTFVYLSATLSTYAKPKEGGKIDKVKYEITYRTKSITDTTKVDSLGGFIYNEEDMRLDVGERVSFFYSYSNHIYEQQRIEMINRGEFSAPAIRGGSINWKLFKNFPEGKTTYVDRVFSDGFRVVEPIEQPRWELMPDSTARILGYDCQMARCNYKGRQWTAWFATDIPIDNGPWKLDGLPGLVLRAYDNSRHYIFDCVGLKQTDGTPDMVFDANLNDYEETSMRSLQQLKANTTPMDIMNRNGKGVTFKVVSGSVNGKLTEAQQESMRRQMQKKQPQNPIER
ncbi:GLPGLI family protein [Prevotella falsenii]|uniref:GLPGLI family protein n=1 Tax=Prevotella falsenii TaxID=515414 RepID=UPI000468554B|nr:GLPGLI family protein [Prevotella falsenii]